VSTNEENNSKSLKKTRMDLMKDWEISADGRSVTRTFTMETPKEASRFAGRIVAFSIKQGLPVDLHCDGTAVVVGMPSSAQASPTNLLDRKQRGMAQRMDRFLSRPAKEPKDETAAAG